MRLSIYITCYSVLNHAIPFPLEIYRHPIASLLTLIHTRCTCSCINRLHLKERHYIYACVAFTLLKHGSEVYILCSLPATLQDSRRRKRITAGSHTSRRPHCCSVVSLYLRGTGTFVKGHIKLDSEPFRILDE